MPILLDWQVSLSINFSDSLLNLMLDCSSHAVHMSVGLNSTQPHFHSTVCGKSLRSLMRGITNAITNAKRRDMHHITFLAGRVMHCYVPDSMTGDTYGCVPCDYFIYMCQRSLRYMGTTRRQSKSFISVSVTNSIFCNYCKIRRWLSSLLWITSEMHHVLRPNLDSAQAVVNTSVSKPQELAGIQKPRQTPSCACQLYRIVRFKCIKTFVSHCSASDFPAHDGPLFFTDDRVECLLVRMGA